MKIAMKTSGRILLGLIVLAHYFSALGQEISTPYIKHDTYIVGKRLISKQAIERTNYSNYDFMYLMTGPKWKKTDFDASASQIGKDMINPHHYPKGDSGESLVPYLIRKAGEAGTKVMYCVGIEKFNPGKDKSTFYTVAEDGKKRSRFARTVVAYMKKYNMDGIDIDWEHDVDLNLHAALMAGIRQELDRLQKKNGRRYYLTTAMHTSLPFTSETVKKLIAQVDWVNFMTYDMGGGR